VTPQVKIGKYKIDFVLEELESKMAIICDGTMSNENYNLEEGFEVQLDLEGIGWTFFRIRSSEFYYDPEKVMEKLYTKLKNNNLITEQLKVV
jgi:very-short-patch-repair endonuclease